jgi:UDP-N-acetylmuramoyl-L-alanyl-D-glutamate--2,6-diaminopimelate ligase
VPYHEFLAVAANIYYGFPSRKLIVIGVTGTKGKTTTTQMIARVLEEAGLKVGLINTVMFKVAEKEWSNNLRITMPGRFYLQRLLNEMVKPGCKYAVIETSSEGIAQNRHWGIAYDVAVFTNLAPEHIESHGSFENYKEAKSKLFRALTKNVAQGFSPAKKIIVANLDDEYGEYFLGFEADEKWGYTLEKSKVKSQKSKVNIVNGEDVELRLNLMGKFNIYNALAATCVGLSQGIKLETIKNALEKMDGIPGRMEKIEEGQNFAVIVDYAHTEESFKNIFETLKPHYTKNWICIFGSAGGIRDKAKRPKLAAAASNYCDYIILTNEDPYDTAPQEILKDIEVGIKKDKIKDYWLIEDREKAIKKGISFAEQGDLVLVLGKGTENCIKMGDKKIPWDDRGVCRRLIRSVDKL